MPLIYLYVLLFGRELEITARLWAKLISAVVVVIMNYFISKWFVFRQKKLPTDEREKSEK